MPPRRIDLCFSGWIRGLNVTNVMDVKSGDTIFLGTKTTTEEIVEKLKSGEWALSLRQILSGGEYRDEEIELFDFDVEKKEDYIHVNPDSNQY
jgi:hypothetical protein